MKCVSPRTFSPHNNGEAHHKLWKICTVFTSLFFIWFNMLLRLMVSGSMKPVKAKKFSMLRAWCRIEADADCTVNDEKRKLHL